MVFFTYSVGFLSGNITVSVVDNERNVIARGLGQDIREIKVLTRPGNPK